MAKTTKTGTTTSGNGVKSTVKGKNVFILPDTTLEEVIQYDKEGGNLVWDPENFRELAEEDLRMLRSDTRARYSVFLELRNEAYERDPKDEEVVSSIKVTPDAGSAMTKLEIRNRKSGYDYRWERPDMVDVRLEEGYRYAKGIKTLRGAQPDGTHRIGSHGQTELVALEIPAARKEAAKKNRRLRRKKAIDGIPSKARSEVEGLGGGFVDENTSASGGFQPVSHGEVTNG